MAGDHSQGAPPGRAHQGGRRRREVRDPRNHPARSGARRRVPRRLERPAGSTRAGGSDPGHAGRADPGAARRRGRHRGIRHAPGHARVRARRRPGEFSAGLWRGLAEAASRRRRGVKKLWEVRELSTVAILVLEILFFTWWLWPDGNRSHPFLNTSNGLLILKYSAIYGIAAVGAAMVIISGGIDLAPGAVMALAGVVGAHLFLVQGWPLGGSMTVGVLVGLAAGLVSAALIVLAKLPPFIATLGVMGISRGFAF